MSTSMRPARLMVDAQTKPVLPRHIKLRHDAGRDAWVLLAPERVFNPDPIAVEVLKLCDGNRNVGEIAVLLAKDFQASEETIRADLIAMLQDLADKGVVKS